MDELCGSEFWNMNLTWYTDSPDFTPCFKETVLVWIPCMFLWIFLPLQIYNLKRSEYGDIPWNGFNVIKLVLIFITTILALLNIINGILCNSFETKVYFYSNIINFITTVLFLFLTYNCKKMGIQSSGVLLTFSFLCILCGLPNFATTIKSLNSNYIEGENATKNSSYLLTYICNLTIFLLNCFPGEPSRHSPSFKTENTKKPPNRSVISDVFLTWMDSYFWKNYKKPTDQILWHYYAKNDGSRNLLRKKKDANLVSILKLLNKKYGSIFWFTTFLHTLYQFASFGLYILVHFLLSAINDDEPSWKCFIYIILLFAISVLQIFIISYYWNWCCRLEIQVKNAVLITLYEKSLIISNRVRAEYTTSDIVNMMSVDVNLLQGVFRNIHSLLGISIFIILSFIYLGIVLGYCVGFGVLALILLLIMCYNGSVHLKNLQRKEAQHKSIRNRFMQEIFSGIKVLKMYAWEKCFIDSVDKLREEEETNLERIGFLYGSLQVYLTCAPYLLIIITFISRFLTFPKEPIGPIPVIMTVVLFYMFRNFLTIIPNNYLSILQGVTAIKRINKFLSSEELNPKTISRDATVEPMLLMKNATFSWASNTGPEMLRNLNVQIKKGELVAVIGAVGAGKSSFISACLGDMYKMSGYINTKGTVAYVPQEAWILNTTLKDNIILSDNINNDLYEKAVEVCALKRDIENIPGKDLAEIGEKGVNLSGGQKQRVSLARAVYQNADMYYFDDPLSALDFDVAQHVFHKAIGSKSILKEKTRILVTHSAKFFPFVDKLIVLKNGSIVEMGTYEELLSHGGEFAEFVRVNSEEVRSDNTNQSKPLIGSTIENEIINTKKNSENSSRNNSLQEKQRGPITNVEDFIFNKLINEETIQTDQVQKRLFYSYMSTAGVFLTISTIALFALGQLFMLVSNLYISVWLTEKNAWDLRYYFLLVYTGLGIVQGIVYQIGNKCLFKGVMKTSKIMYNTLLNSVLRWPMYLFDTIPVGRIISRFSDDVYILDNVIGYLMGQTMISFSRNVATYIFCIFVVPETVVVLIPSVFVYYGIQLLYGCMFHQMKRVEAVHRSPLYSHLVQSVTGFQSIRAYNLENKFILLAKTKNRLCSSAYYSSSICTRWLSIRCEIVGVICYILMVFITYYKKDDTHFSYVVSLIIIGVTIIKSISLMVMQQSLLGDSILSFERIEQYIKLPQEASWDQSELTLDEKWPRKGDIVFKDYKLQYRTGLGYVLKGINFKIKNGEKVGIIGRTGAGKSSIFLGLFRIVEPSGGTILIDGVDITKLGLHSLRSKITVIPQDAVLFSGTLRFNIDPSEIYTDESIWNVLEKSHLKQFVNSLPEGLNYIFEEGGKNMSFGQKQLICLARALLRKTKILVLDEATASVDVKTDELIQKTIREEFSDCTVITIAHRLNTLQNYDKILVMDDGKVARYDTVVNLMKAQYSK